MLYVYNNNLEQTVKFKDNDLVKPYFTQLVSAIKLRQVKSVNILTPKGLFTWHINKLDLIKLEKMSLIEVIYSRCKDLNTISNLSFNLSVVKKPLYINGKAYRISII